MRIIGYVFEADNHCIACTKYRVFLCSPESLNAPDATQSDENGIPVHAIDNEGNPIHPIFSTDEQLEPLYCGDCREEIK